MADDPQSRHESWQIERPGRVALVAIAVPLVLLLILLGAGRWFETTIGKRTFRPPETFPAPGLVETITRPTGDGVPPRPAGSVRDPEVELAKNRLLASGIEHWEDAPQ